jgi:hypothetical protein
MPKPPSDKPVSTPAHEIRVGGIQATIWKNDTPQGARYNTTFKRNFRDGEEWKSSDAFGRDDLAMLGFVAAEALRWIVAQRQTAQPLAR